jgi:hypothetical protein
MFYIRQILAKKWEYNGTVHQPFVYFKKTFDLFRMAVLYGIIIEFGIPGNIFFLYVVRQMERLVV